MKVVVIGLGSMGKRRIRILKNEYPDIDIFGMDSSVSRQEEAGNLYGIRICSVLEEAVNDGVTCAFVCASPLAHQDIIKNCLFHGLHVFSELNVVSDGYSEIIDLANTKKRVLFLSSTFLYRTEIQHIKKRVKEHGGKFTYFYHVGQYLPDWHPWEKVEDFFVFDKRTNGCREILVRELPWLTQVFGDVANWKISKDSYSSLPLDYPDTYLMILEHLNGTKGLVLIDVVSRKATINLEVINEEIYISWDGTPTGLKEYDTLNKNEIEIATYESFDHQENYSSSIIENAYSAEIEAFFNEIEKGIKPEYGFETDQKVLDLMDCIENEVFDE